jgi:hypothetical protein
MEECQQFFSIPVGPTATASSAGRSQRVLTLQIRKALFTIDWDSQVQTVVAKRFDFSGKPRNGIVMTMKAIVCTFNMRTTKRR